MALKHKITAKEFEKLSDDIKKEYEKSGDGYTLDVEGIDDADELRRARDREKETAKQLKKDLKAAQDRLDEIDGDDNRKKGDIKAIDDSWKAKIETLTNDTNTKLSAKDAFIKKTLIDGVATQVATKISNTPTLLSKAIRERLDVDFSGDEPKLVILGDDGKPDSKLTVDKLEKEFVANPEFKAIIVGSKASGGGAPPKERNERSGGADGSGKDEPGNSKDLSKLTGKDLAAHLKAQKEKSKESAE